MRTWLRRPEDNHWSDFEGDPTTITTDEDAEEVFESQTYRLKPDFQTFGLLLRILLGGMSEDDVETQTPTAGPVCHRHHPRRENQVPGHAAQVRWEDHLHTDRS